MVNGHHATSCTTPARAGVSVQSETAELNAERRMMVQLLFVEGNHFCPSCEKSGHCKLQAVAYDLGMTSPRFDHFFPDRPVDASHPELLLDFNRCILCELCVRASAEVDHKNVFALSGRGITKHLIVNAESGRLADTDIAVTDKAVEVCPVGVILKKRVGFAVPMAAHSRASSTVLPITIHCRACAASCGRWGESRVRPASSFTLRTLGMSGSGTARCSRSSSLRWPTTLS
jgi:[NiFe] hydrogenase diaphorase moiety small subunit